MYEVMTAWEQIQINPNHSSYILEYAAIWQKAKKIVFSKTLNKVSTAKTQIERNFDPKAILQMKEESVGNLLIGGPNLASQAIKAELIDEFHLFIIPLVVGGGKRYIPDNVWLNLELKTERRFQNGTIYLYYIPKY